MYSSRMYTMISSVFLLSVLLSWPSEISANGDIGGLESEKPRNVVAEVINGTGISLRWEPPKVTSPSCPVKGYIVRLKTDQDKRPKRWTVDPDRYALKLFSLLESTTYHVRVLAVLCNGKMTHSQWVTIQTRRRPVSDVTSSSSSISSSSGGGHTSSGNSILEDRPPGKPQSVKTRTFSDSVFVSWLSPDEDIVVRGYMVGYGEGVPDVNWQYVDSRARNLTINNLKSSTQYVISLRAFNNVDKGPVVYDLVHTREKIAVPSVNPVTSTPSNLKARILSSTTVWLQWTDSSLGAEQTITDNRYYNVHYQALPNGKTLSVIVKALHVVLYDLTPGTEYSFKVRTINDAKSSPFSLMVLNKTLEAAPGSAPQHVEAVVSNGSIPSVTIKWKAPAETNGEVSGYLLLYTDSVTRNTTDWTVVGVEGWMTDTTLPDLKPDTVYQLKMQARNSMGYGPLSPIITFRTAPLPVSHKTPVLGESVHDDGDLQDFLEDMGAKGKDDQPAASTLVKVKEERQSIGVVRSAARVIDNSDADASPRAAAMTGPAPIDLDLKTVVRHTVNAVLTFKPPVPSCNAPSAPLTGGDKSLTPGLSSAGTTYRVRMLDFAQAQEVKVIPVEAGTVLLEGLRPWRVYRYQVEAVDESGAVIGVSKEDVIDTKP